MTTIGTLLFCADCGNLLDNTLGVHQRFITCDLCGSSCEDTAARQKVLTSKDSAFPSMLRMRREAVQDVAHETMTRGTINEKCQKCGREEVGYYTLQTRGADEGTTVFYECECGYKWSQNN